jgi:type I restriction enzyme R subunit
LIDFYSLDESQLALDLCLFINGLPVATFELKNNLTKQTAEDAVQQYKRDRNPRELLCQLIGLEREGKAIFDSIVVVTDRRVLDRQIQNTIKQFTQVSATVGHADRSLDLRRFLAEGKKIIITTVQKFPVVMKEIGDDHRGRSFAIIIDEAHSSQGGRTSAKMNIVLSKEGREMDDETIEDRINRIMESRKMLSSASYFAFTATPKNKTLEIFGEPFKEGFILDVLKNYTPVNSYYRLMKKVEDDPEFDTKKAQKKLRRYVEQNDHAIRMKAEIMVDHFHNQVLARNMIGGQAKAMVITGGIRLAIEYYQAICSYLTERNSPWKAIVAFSGEHDYGGQKVTEASLNGFPSNIIPDRFREDPYRFLVVADKFQTGYDEPLLHTMYVDKPLSDIKAVQTLSRLNRAHPQKHDTFVLDFFNDSDTIQAAFEPYYRTTILSEETDPNRLHDLKADLDGYQFYNWIEVNHFVELYLAGTDRERIDPILDSCVHAYMNETDEDGQVDFKGKAKGFVRTYGFLASILPFTNAEWEKLSIFLNFLIPKLPAPKEEDLSRGILEAIDMESYRIEVRSSMNIILADQNGIIDPVPMGAGGHLPEPELDLLSNIINAFNEQFGNIDWRDADKIRRVITEEIPEKVSADKAYQNAIKNSDKQNARIEHDKALQRVIVGLLSDHAELFRQFSDNPTFKKWLSDTIFMATYSEAAG